MEIEHHLLESNFLTMFTVCNNILIRVFGVVLSELRTLTAFTAETRNRGRTGPPGNLALARWAGWSAGQVGRHVKCRRREWNGGGSPEALSYRD